MDIRVINDINDSRLSCWNDVLARSVSPLPYQRYEWAQCWYRHCVSYREELFVVLAVSNGTVMGIAPFLRTRGLCRHYSSLKFIGSGYFDYFDFIIAAGNEKEVIKAFINYLAKECGCCELQLKYIPEDSAAFRIITQISLPGEVDISVYPEDVVPYIALPKIPSQMEVRTKRVLRADVRRRERRLRELGSLEFKWCRKLSEATDALEGFFRLHIKKWEAIGGYSAYKFESRRGFLRDLLCGLFDKNLANVFYLLYKGSRIIAACFSFTMGKRLIFYSTAYDPEFAKCSPGKVLLNKMIEYSIDEHYEEFNFGIGAESYKLEWPHEIRELKNIFLFTRQNIFLNCVLRLRRSGINFYYLSVLPRLRKLPVLVSVWRFLNRKRARQDMRIISKQCYR